jgi:hypothetical protein
VASCAAVETEATAEIDGVARASDNAEKHGGQNGIRNAAVRAKP